jgi:hypothetical protein
VQISRHNAVADEIEQSANGLSEDVVAAASFSAHYSITALSDAYYAAWTRCNLEPDGRPPKARFVQELVTAWKELRKTMPGQGPD